MKRIVAVIASVAVLGLAPVQSGHAEVNVNVNIGVPAVPVPPPPQIMLPAPPEFILPSALGFYVAVDVPYDIFFTGNTYYLYKDNRWHRSASYNGPWRYMEYRDLPPGLRKHKHEQIRRYRDEEYRRYRHDHDNYRGRHFRPDKERKEERKEVKRREKEERKEDKRYEKELRKDEKRHEKEQRKNDRDDHQHEQGRHGGHD